MEESRCQKVNEQMQRLGYLHHCMFIIFTVRKLENAVGSSGLKSWRDFWSKRFQFAELCCWLFASCVFSNLT